MNSFEIECPNCQEDINLYEDDYWQDDFMKDDATTIHNCECGAVLPVKSDLTVILSVEMEEYEELKELA